MPLQGQIITKYGEKTKHGANKGINIAAKAGEKVVASTGGKVIYASFDHHFGNLILVKSHATNDIISYGHLEDIIVKPGQDVKQNSIIGYVGTSGQVTSPQLYFSIRQGKKAVNPLSLIEV